MFSKECWKHFFPVHSTFLRQVQLKDYVWNSTAEGKLEFYEADFYPKWSFWIVVLNYALYDVVMC